MQTSNFRYDVTGGLRLRLILCYDNIFSYMVVKMGFKAHYVPAAICHFCFHIFLLKFVITLGFIKRKKEKQNDINHKLSILTAVDPFKNWWACHLLWTIGKSFK